jgi:chemotaxis protein methyltransferase CheR
VLLYFDRETRERAFKRLASSLAHDGFLMLGAGETVIGQTIAFEPVAQRASIYSLTQRPWKDEPQRGFIGLEQV